MNLKLLGKRILIEKASVDEKTKSGILLSSIAKEQTLGVVSHIGNLVTLVEVGETVYFQKYGIEEMEIEGRSVLLCEEENIIAIMK